MTTDLAHQGARIQGHRIYRRARVVRPIAYRVPGAEGRAAPAGRQPPAAACARGSRRPSLRRACLLYSTLGVRPSSASRARARAVYRDAPYADAGAWLHAARPT